MNTALLFSFLPILSTLLGGFAVYRWKKDLHPWLSVSGGVLLAVAFLDLLPEAIERGTEAHVEVKLLLGATLGAILLFHLLDKILAFHAHHEHPQDGHNEPCENDKHKRTKAWIRGFSMCFHSFLDGVAIGSGFAVDFRLGLLVTTAVVMHDFSDGMSTVTVLKHGLGHNHRGILPVLFLDALAPFVGARIGTLLGLNSTIIAFMLATFSGFFIFLSLSELLPQAHEGKMSSKFGLSLTALGILIVIFIQSVATI